MRSFPPLPSSQPTRRSFLQIIGLGALTLVRPGAVSAAAVETSPEQIMIVPVSAAGVLMSARRVPKIIKTNAQWRAQLSAAAYRVTRHAGTEPAYSGHYENLEDAGIFRCICCDTALYSSKTKFDSGTGWPSFWAPIARENVTATEDRGFFGTRTEITCSRCDAHLGHVFTDGPAPTSLRYCMNSVALKFDKLA